MVIETRRKCFGLQRNLNISKEHHLANIEARNRVAVHTRQTTRHVNYLIKQGLLKELT